MSYASILAAQRQNYMNLSLIGWSHLGSLIVKNLRQPWLMQRRRNKCIVAKVDIERNSLALPTFKTADRAEMRDYRFSLPRLFPYLPSDHRATVVVHYNKDSGSGLRKKYLNIILLEPIVITNCICIRLKNISSLGICLLPSSIWNVYFSPSCKNWACQLPRGSGQLMRN